VRALATSDQRIVEYLRAISFGKKPRGGSPIDGVISINELFKVEAEEFNEALKLKIWDKVAIGNYRSFEEAKKFAISKKFKSKSEWIKFTKTKEYPRDIPISLFHIYRGQWKGFMDFLGLGIAKEYKNFLNFEAHKLIAKKLKIKNSLDWQQSHQQNKLPDNVYHNPRPIFIKSKEWKGWGDFLGTGKLDLRRSYINLDQAKKYAKKLKFKQTYEWFEHTKNESFPSNIPKFPNQSYKNKGWKSWADFLGAKNYSNNKRVYRSYDEAKKYIKNLNLKSAREWEDYVKGNKEFPLDIPKRPAIPYQNKGWKGWGDFLGTGNQRGRNFGWKKTN